MFVMNVNILDQYIPQLPDFVWEIGVGIIGICILLYFLYKYLDTGQLPSGKGMKF